MLFNTFEKIPASKKAGMEVGPEEEAAEVRDGLFRLRQIELVVRGVLFLNCPACFSTPLRLLGFCRLLRRSAELASKLAPKSP